MLCFPTQIKVGTLCVKNHQVLRLEHRLGLMEILKNLKRNIFCLKKKKNKYSFVFERTQSLLVCKIDLCLDIFGPYNC